MNGQSKSILLSTTFWGVIITAASQALSPVLTKYGISVDSAATAQWVVTGLGACIAVYGRWKASQAVHLVAPPPEAPK